MADDTKVTHLFGNPDKGGGSVGDQVKILLESRFDEMLKAGFDEYELCHGFVSEGLKRLLRLQGKDATVDQIHGYAQAIGRGVLDQD